MLNIANLILSSIILQQFFKILPLQLLQPLGWNKRLFFAPKMVSFLHTFSEMWKSYIYRKNNLAAPSLRPHGAKSTLLYYQKHPSSKLKFVKPTVNENSNKMSKMVSNTKRCQVHDYPKSPFSPSQPIKLHEPMQGESNKKITNVSKC